MRKILGGIFLLGMVVAWRGYGLVVEFGKLNSGAPPYGVAEEEVPEDLDPYAWIREWERPEGPAKVALQVGHWKNDDFPEELARLRNNDGASGGGKSEWEVNLAIAEEVKKLLEPVGIEVEILPATVPPKYWADVFVAIHADGNVDSSVRGYKFAGPWRDFSKKSEELVEILNESYEEVTGFVRDPNISRNMRGYYAFSWWRFEHAIHPMTIAVIAETGFLSNYYDRLVIVDQPELAARGIAEGLVKFLEREELI